MLSYKKILVATDLSEDSVTVIETANAIAKKCNASVSLIHVMEQSPFAYAGEFSVALEPNLEQALENSARQILEKFGSKFSIDEDKLYLMHGSVKNNVSEKINKIGADLIVVGTHGHHGINFLLGSYANAILHAASCDVYVVRISE